MIHPSTEVRRISDVKGYGLFATRFIPMGTITWVRDQLDREISPEALESYDEKIKESILHFSYRNSRGNYIFCWDNTRYINHDCSPNTCVTAYELEVAVRDIQMGEEITNHYGMLNIIEPFTLYDQKDTTIYPDDLLRHGEAWDDLLRAAFADMVLVEQPLRGYLSAEMWSEIRAVSQGEKTMESIKNCYFPGKA